MSIETIRELFAYGRWANECVFQAAAPLSDVQLDRPFEMGEGSLRATLRHIYGAERNWHERVQAPGWETFPEAAGLHAVAEIHAAAGQLATARFAWLAGLADAHLDRRHTYHFATGGTYTSRLRDILLHVCTHGIHHRAQALNMLRHVGATPPALDWIEWTFAA